MNAPTTSRRSGRDAAAAVTSLTRAALATGMHLPSVSPRPVRVSAGSWSVAHTTAADFASDGRVSIAARPA